MKKSILITSDTKDSDQYNEWLGLISAVNVDIIITNNDIVPRYISTAETFCSRHDNYKRIDNIHIYRESEWLNITDDSITDEVCIVITSKDINSAITSRITSTHKPTIVVCESESTDHRVDCSDVTFLCYSTTHTQPSLSYINMMIDTTEDEYKIHATTSYSWLTRYMKNQKPV